MDIKDLEEIIKKILQHLDKQKRLVLDQRISLSDTAIYDLLDSITTYVNTISNNSEIDDAFGLSILNIRSIIEKAVNNNDNELYMKCIAIIESILINFYVSENSWYDILNNHRLFWKCEEYSKEQWEKHILKQVKKESIFTGRGVVYTAIIGDYDALNTPLIINPDWDYICYTDNKNLSSDVWEIRHVGQSELDNVRTARKIKIGMEDVIDAYDYSIWVDGKITIIGDLREMIDRYSISSPILCFPHFQKDCAYEEALSCIRMGKGNSDEIERQVDWYRKEGYPENNGLIDSCVLVRDHNDRALRETMNIWLNEVLNRSSRDQISFGYSCWKTGLKYDLCNLSIASNSYVDCRAH